ncbi:MAG: hypothetical protein AAFY71_19615 [Bacteroidota bacterium]
MEFHFSDYENPSGKLGRQINDIITQKYFAIPDESLLQMEKNDPEYVNHVSRSNELSNWSKLNHVTGTQEPNRILKISRPEIFIDFIQDLNHSQIFQNSPHFDRLKTVIRGNFIFQTLSNKVDLLFYLNWSSGGNNTYVTTQFSKSLKAYKSNITDPKGAKFLAGTGWFNSNMEDEVWDLIHLEKEGIGFQNQLIDESLASWYLSRYNFFRIGFLLFKENSNILLIFLLPLLVMACGIMYLQYFRLPYMGTPFEAQIFSAGFFMLLLWNLFILIAATIRTKYWRLKLDVGVQVVSPKLLIILFGAWAALRKIFEESLGLRSVWVAILSIILIIILFPTYLFREIKANAPDMTRSQIFGRITQVFFVGTFYTFLTGIIISAALKNASNDWFVNVIIYVPTILFSALVIGQISNGRRFTGL